MRRIVIAAILCAAVVIPAAAQVEGVSEEDMKAIEKAAFDYVDGALSGDAERIANALHPELSKLFIRPLPNGREITTVTTRSSLIEGACKDRGIPVVLLSGTGHFGQLGVMGTSYLPIEGAYIVLVPRERVDEADALGEEVLGEIWESSRLRDEGEDG